MTTLLHEFTLGHVLLTGPFSENVSSLADPEGFVGFGRTPLELSDRYVILLILSFPMVKVASL